MNTSDAAVVARPRRSFDVANATEPAANVGARRIALPPVNINPSSWASTKSSTRWFATLFPGAAEIAAMFAYFQAHTYLGSDMRDRIALANKIAGRQPTRFSTWARVSLPVHASA